MIIENTNVTMRGKHSLIEEHIKEESLRVWVGDERPDFKGIGMPSQPPVLEVQLSQEAQDMSKQAVPIMPGVEIEPSMTSREQVELDILIAVIEAFTGKKLAMLNARDLIPENINTTVEELEAPPPEHAESETEPAGWGVEYDYHESHFEQEDMSFEAQGVVRTRDGTEIDFVVHIEMNRTFRSEENINFRAGDAVRIDPLVINFDGSAAELTNAKFSFDLDADGDKDRISFVGAGSGFLVFDRNGDGTVNNGTELFGPQTGNGFSELAQYDEDGNGWIDENDTIFSELRIWNKDPKGNDHLATLRQRDVGAIYLGNMAIPFVLKNETGEELGELQSSGIYISEDYSVGTVQQINLFA